MTRASRMAALALVGPALLGAASPTDQPPTDQPPTDSARLLLTITDPRVTESSGLAASRLHEGVLWTHDDSGGGPELFAIAPDGSTVAVLTLSGLEPRDWEALAPTTDEQGRPALLVGDIGDNSRSRERGILLHLVAEPRTLADAEVEATSYRLVYADGPHDAEALAVDPRTGRVLVVTKDLFGGAVYAAPQPLDAARPNELERLGDAPPMVTDAAALPDGRLVVRDYAAATVLGADLEERGEIALPPQPQGETLALSADGTALLAGSEGEASEVWQVPLPSSTAARGGSPTPRGGDDVDAGEVRRGTDDAAAAPAAGAGPPAGALLLGAVPVDAVLVLVAALLLLAAGLVLVARRR